MPNIAKRQILPYVFTYLCYLKELMDAFYRSKIIFRCNNEVQTKEQIFLKESRHVLHKCGHYKNILDQKWACLKMHLVRQARNVRIDESVTKHILCSFLPFI